MIQPATTTRPPTAHARHAPPAAGGAVFALPDEASEGGIPTGDAAAGLAPEERQDDAAPGNALPLDPFAALVAFQPLPAEQPVVESPPTRAAAPSASPLPPVSVTQIIPGALPLASPSPTTAARAVDGKADVSSPTDPRVTGIDPQIFAGSGETAAVSAVSAAPADLRATAGVVVPGPTPPSAMPIAQPAHQPPTPTISVSVVAGPRPQETISPPVLPLITEPVPALAAVAGSAAPIFLASPAIETPSPTQAEAANIGRDDLPLPPTLAAPAAPAVGTTASAAIVFGAAKAAAQRDQHDDKLALPAQSDPLLTAVASADRLAVAAPGGGAQASLDMRDHRWPHAMMAQIEALRDAADAGDTRIRLVPDALGSIDIGVRQDGDTLHVRFTADQAQTRALLQDAQPRLAEAAEARGLRLGQTSVDAGASGQGQQRQPLPSHEPRRPAPAADTRPADAEPADDGRLA